MIGFLIISTFAHLIIYVAKKWHHKKLFIFVSNVGQLLRSGLGNVLIAILGTLIQRKLSAQKILNLRAQYLKALFQIRLKNSLKFRRMTCQELIL